MCDFHARLIAAAEKLGAQHVRIEHGGARGGPRRFRRHPHLTGEINGVVFAFPIKSRPRDATHGYRQRYLRTLRAYLREVGRFPAVRPERDVTAPMEKKRRPPSARAAVRPRQLVPTDGTPTRLDRDPWAPLRALVVCQTQVAMPTGAKATCLTDMSKKE